ncbi:UNVERIFIED_CONTAM: hypothetical protein GTU68_015058 [Idotea baltica]|nr:hypothetical protein [Idotea baltica]
MYDVSKGQILVDGRDIREYDLQQLRSQIGYIPQDVFLFSDTIANNISFGTEAQENQAHGVEFYAQKAAVHADILSLPQTYETRIGERGVTLSGGQKQRVAMARAFMKNPNLVILDDCLSAVDTTTENQILEYFNEILVDKTTLVITHRIYGLLQFDKIIVLDDGAIIEEGTHNDLLSQKGFYAKMYERQQLREDESEKF